MATGMLPRAKLDKREECDVPKAPLGRRNFKEKTKDKD
jgi:hypothetical protein